MVAVGGLRLDEPQVRGLGAVAVSALAIGAWHCAQELTDGILTRQALAGLGIGAAAREKLVKAGLWRELEDGSIQVVDYLEHNPSRAYVEARRGKASERMRRHRGGSVPQAPPVTAHVRANVPANERGNELPNALFFSPSPPLTLSPSGSESSLNPESSSVLASDPKDLTGSARVAKRGPKRKQETEFPDDFSVTETEIKLASELGLTEHRERAAFKDKALAHGWTAKDWRARYRTWLRKAQEFSAASRPPGAIQHEKTRQDEAKRPYHEFFKLEPVEDRASPAEALEAIQRATAGIGRRV